MVNFENDYLFGLDNENKIKDILENKFGELKKNHRYSKYDFENDKYVIELKTRRICYNQYPTTLLTCNKVIETTKKIYFIFNFTDGIYYIRYKEKLFNTFDKKMFSRINKSFDEKEYYFIPIQYLKKISI